MEQENSNLQANQLLTAEQTAALLNLKPSTIRKWIFQRRIPVVKIGKAVRIRPEDIHVMLEKGYRPGIPDSPATGQRGIA